MLVIGSFKIYDTVAIMTNGGPGRATKMLVTYIYDVAFNNIKYGQADVYKRQAIILTEVLVMALWTGCFTSTKMENFLQKVSHIHQL